MNYNELKKKLKKYNCYLVAEKTNHEWWYSPISKKHFPIQRHGRMEIGEKLLSKISKESGIKF